MFQTTLYLYDLRELATQYLRLNFQSHQYNALQKGERDSGVVLRHRVGGIFSLVHRILSDPMTRKVNMLKGGYLVYLNQAQWKDNNKRERVTLSLMLTRNLNIAKNNQARGFSKIQLVVYSQCCVLIG